MNVEKGVALRDARPNAVGTNTIEEVLWQMYAMDSPVRSWQLSPNVDGSWYASLLFDWNVGNPKINKQNLNGKP